MKYKTILTAKAQVVQPHTDDFKAIASSLKDTYGFDLKPQMDLLYVRSCLVSAGPGVGVNDNDDIFTREEAWASRQSPILKPFNWQHNDKDILGVIYTVQARNLDGEILDISDETPPDCDFDLWVEAAIFSLIHEARAAEIQSRAKAGTLFVSMEAWFDDYSYGLCQSDKSIKVLSRNQSTAFLEKQLRAMGGPGVYRDPESNQDVRIGRVLKCVTFGGCGFVDRPANKRSVIEAVGPMNSLAERDHESEVRLLLQKVLECVEDNRMNANANTDKPAKAGDDIGAAVESVLDRREKAAAAEKAQQELVARADNATKQSQELQTKVNELSEANKAKETQVQTLNKQLSDYNELVSQLVKEQAAAGATSSTPAEISAIDAAKDGDAAFKAKLAWLQKSMSSLKTRAARADELEKQLAEAEAVVREQEVRALLEDVISPEALEHFVTHASKLSEEAYGQWRDEKELMVLEIAAKKPPFPPAKKGAKPVAEEEEEVPAEKGCANLFAALLNKRRSESGSANPDTMNGNPNEPKLINQPLGPGVNSGVNSGQLKTPRHKIAGSAGDNPAKKLENAQEEGGVSLAGAQTRDDGEGVSPFRVLANLVAETRETKEDEKQGEKRPGFDPVQ
jgi:hypothetical protein